MSTLNPPPSEAQNSSQWHLPDGAIARLPGSANAIAFSPDGSQLAVAEWQDIWIYDAHTRTELVRLTGHNYKVESIAYSTKSKTLASGGRDGVRLWDTTTHNLIKILEHPKGVNSVSFSPDGTLASGGGDGTVRLWNVTEGTLIKTLKAHNGAVNSVAFSRDGTLASGGSDGDVQLWDATKSTLIETLEDPLTGLAPKVNSVAFNPDGTLVASGTEYSVRLWNITKEDQFGLRRVERLREHGEGVLEVLSVAFSPDGILASGNADGTVRLWDAEGTLIKTLTGHNDAVESVAFSSDGTLASGGSDGTVLWQLPLSTRPIYNTTTTSFSSSKGVKAMDFPEKLISDVVLTEDATYFVLNLQFLTLEFNRKGATYGPCVITLDIPGVLDEPLIGWYPTNRLITNPSYFMYPLLSPQQRIDVVNDKFQWDTKDVIIGATAAAVSGGVAAKVKLLLPITRFGGKYVLNIGSRFQLLFRNTKRAGLSRFVICKVAGKATNYLTATGLNTVFASEPIEQDREEPTIEEQILAFTADPFLILQPSPEWTYAWPPDVESRYLFRIPRRMEKIHITVEQVYSLKTGNDEEPVAYTAEFGAVWNLLAAAAPHAQPMSLADYRPFQLLPPEAQADLLQHFNGTMNVNAEQWQIPEETTLLPNYPNPFNPETWIPYQLAKPADVRVTLYDTNGRVVRDLDLGHQRPGIYQSRARAAYWDGRNQVGEPVASGVYFYTLTTDNFTATRQMLIRK